MLQAIGARSIDDLFALIPAEYRLERDLKVPRQMAEIGKFVEVVLRALAGEWTGYATLLVRRDRHDGSVIIDA